MFVVSQLMILAISDTLVFMSHLMFYTGRYLRHLEYEVCYVRNFTDVDDKIIARANELGEDPLSLSNKYCNEFHSDMAYLHCLSPSVEPRVSNHMPQIIDMIKQILDNGCAYRIDGDVYFSVEKFPEYGCLSGRKLEDNRAGERVAVDSRKQNPADFALWKSAKAGEPFWESPWGPGRPGWHIECSAMSAAYLGYSFDIHGGGMDLVFPHHENEIAQSCAACSNSNISYWVHNGFVTVDSEKMSKSLGNFFTIRQVMDLYHPLALRLFLLSTHYRSPINYSDAQLESASDRVFYIYQTLHDCELILSQHNKEIREDSIPLDTLNCINKFSSEFETSMLDDLHTPVVLAAISEPLKTINDLLHTRKGKKQGLRIESLFALEKEIRRVLNVMGLMPSSYAEVLQELREKALKRSGLTEDQVLQKIEARNSARAKKEYEVSDGIRKELAAVGVALMDGPDGTIWRPGVPLELQEHVTTTT
ncbi:cysteinyl-tRNA synthetase, class Ia family protein isoform X2 [Tasmannia lanceolata]|uniref:cysteinyl-tRNA synthetase, class Ia family protein isoform X2 n=1 Tax=Tasmannia lanceolata TaxID=3420 RepID=UPI004062A8BE